ncbi:hypothetical protein ACHAXT_004261 [Thalassiosira profunda]
MLAASSVVDPLVGSPLRARNHDDDMAALQLMELPPLELPPSVASATASVAAPSEDAAQISNAVDECAEDDKSGGDVDDDADGENANCPFQQLMNRGQYLRQLRLLALADEQERLQAQNCDARASSCEEKKEEDDLDSVLPEKQMEDRVTVLANGDKVLDYSSYLAHQRYHDDLKHGDVRYMDFGAVSNVNGEDCGRLVVEQRKRLGKGGLVWDAGFVLGEHVIANEAEWNGMDGEASDPSRIVELGAGTGLTGLMIAKATRANVVVTDLPGLEGLMNDNVRRNFGGGDPSNSDLSDEQSDLLNTHDNKSKGTVTARTLRWGVESDYHGAPYDVLVGADIVTSLYDPVALAQTLHALSGPHTKIYLSGKARLDRPHAIFDVEMHRLFERVERIAPKSRLRSPGVFIIAAEGKL